MVECLAGNMSDIELIMTGITTVALTLIGIYKSNRNITERLNSGNQEFVKIRNLIRNFNKRLDSFEKKISELKEKIDKHCDVK
jgi:peptidoglycan hydrolase CwlO-like protein